MTKLLTVVAIGLLAMPHVTAQTTQHPAGSESEVRNALVGRVLNSADAPVVGAVVTLVRARTDLGAGNQPEPTPPLTGVTTNLLGEFRFSNVLSGSYYVMALPPEERAGNALRVRRSKYAITYYPSADRLPEAQAIVVNSAGTVTADIALISVPLYIVSGFLTDAASELFRNPVVRLTPADVPTGLARALPVTDSAFLIPNVPRGSYCVHVEEGLWPPPRDVKMSRTRIEVVDRDVVNVTLAPTGAIRVTGRVRADAAMRSRMLLGPVQIGASLVEPTCNAGLQRQGRIADDLTFEFYTWPGTGKFVLSQGRLGYVSAKIYRNGQDISDTNVEFQEGRSISGLEIEIIRLPMPVPASVVPTTPVR